MGKGFNLAIKIVKDIDRANTRAKKERERELKAQERASQKLAKVQAELDTLN